MFSYVFMKILEGRPRSYDKHMEKASRGRTRKMKEEVAAEVSPGSRVLELGCGTGELASMLIARRATVEAFDSSPSMVEVAQERIAGENLAGKLTVREMGVDGMDTLPERTYDSVVSTLVLSELSDDERRFAIKHAFRVLRPGGQFVVADEVLPRSRGRRLLRSLLRAPLVATTYLASRTSPRPIADLSGEVSAAGLTVKKEVREDGDALALLVAHRPTDAAERRPTKHTAPSRTEDAAPHRLSGATKLPAEGAISNQTKSAAS